MSKDTFYSVMPLNWLLRGACLSNVYQKGLLLEESRSKSKCATYIIGFGIIYLIFLYYKVINIQRNKQSGAMTFSDSVQMTYWFSYFEYIINIYFVFKSKTMSLVKNFKAFDHIDTILGKPSYDIIRRTIRKSTVFTVIIFCFNSLFDHIAWSLVEGWQAATIYSIDYLYFLLSILAVLDVISHVIQVRYRLQIIGDLLQDHNNENCKKFRETDMKLRVFACDNDKNCSLNCLQTLDSSKSLDMSWISNCYLSLVEQVAYLNLNYGFRVLVYCLNLLLNIINNLNLAIRLLNGTFQLLNPYSSLYFLPCLTSTMRALNYSVMIIMLMYQCEEVYSQSGRILATIDTLLSTDDNFSMKTHLIEFRNLLITRPIKFHAARFFTMDYTVLVSLSSVVVTYTIIMLQSMQ